jgi:hypothetical protein
MSYYTYGDKRQKPAQASETKRINTNKYRTPVQGADELFSFAALYVTEREANVLIAVANQLQAIRSNPNPPQTVTVPLQRPLGEDRRLQESDWSGPDPRVRTEAFSIVEYLDAGGNRMRAQAIDDSANRASTPLAREKIAAQKPKTETIKDDVTRRFSGLDIGE